MRLATRISYSLAGEPHNGQGAHGAPASRGPRHAFCAWWGGDGAARGVGAPASDRAGVRGGAPVSPRYAARHESFVLVWAGRITGKARTARLRAGVPPCVLCMVGWRWSGAG